MSDIEDRIRAALSGAEPSEELVARARRAAAQAAAGAAAARRPRRRALALAATAAVILGGGAATAAVVMDQGPPPAVPTSPAGRAAIGESGVLAQAPWLFQSGGGVPITTAALRPALRFAPGTTYAEALRALVRSVWRNGTLPKGTTLVPHLPRGAVWAPRGRSGPRLDLTAPSGYSVPEGLILPPDLVIDPDVPAAEAERIGKRIRDRLPLGADADEVRIGVPALPACQRLPRRAPCTLEPPPVTKS